MALQKIRLGTNEDGSPHWLLIAGEGEEVLMTGPITGEVTTADGKTYDVTEPFIAVPAADALKVSDAIGAYYQDNGHPGHDADVPFVLTPSELSHDADGTPSAAFEAAIDEQASAGRDSSPAAVITALSPEV